MLYSRMPCCLKKGCTCPSGKEASLSSTMFFRFANCSPPSSLNLDPDIASGRLQMVSSGVLGVALVLLFVLLLLGRI